MEDNGLEPMAFWLPVRSMLDVSLLFVKVYGVFKKTVHLVVLFSFAKSAGKCQTIANSRILVQIRA